MKEYTFLWFVEKYSFNWQRTGEVILSPKFHFGGLEDTAWKLAICPRGREDRDEGFVSLFLFRDYVDDGPEVFPLKFQLSFIAADGSDHRSEELKFPFRRASANGDFQFMTIDELNVQRKAEFLPNNTLTVCCKMWTGEGDVLKAGHISARTRIRTEKLSFFHEFLMFTTLIPDFKKKIQMKSLFKHKISSSLCFVDDSNGDVKISVETVSDFDCYLHKCTVALLESSGNLIDCGEADCGRRINSHVLPLSITGNDILKNRSTYLPGDTLTLLCELTVSTLLYSGAIEEIPLELPLSATNKKKHRNRKNKNKRQSNKNKLTDSESIQNVSENVSEHPGVSEDMKALYNEQCLADVQLKTKKKSFAAHKNVLCARSPVFKEMLTNEKKKKITDCIQVDDLEDDIVQQLMLFLYSDCLEPLQWRSATQLYYAADKYAVRKLQAMCSSFLVENLTSSNACELLLLADVHNDSSLKEIVEDFILENDEQVFGSNEWEKLMETNPQLVLKTMHLKYKKNAK